MCSSRACIHGTRNPVVAEPRFITSVLDVVSAVSASERIDHFRAYRKYPELDLPTTTGSVEAMNRRVRDLMRQTRSISSPQALQLWAIALIRTRPIVVCNGKHFSTK